MKNNDRTHWQESVRNTACTMGSPRQECLVKRIKLSYSLPTLPVSEKVDAYVALIHQYTCVCPCNMRWHQCWKCWLFNLVASKSVKWHKDNWHPHPEQCRRLWYEQLATGFSPGNDEGGAIIRCTVFIASIWNSLRESILKIYQQIPCPEGGHGILRCQKMEEALCWTVKANKGVLTN